MKALAGIYVIHSFAPILRSQFFAQKIAIIIYILAKFCQILLNFAGVLLDFAQILSKFHIRFQELKKYHLELQKCTD